MDAVLNRMRIVQTGKPLSIILHETSDEWFARNTRQAVSTLLSGKKHSGNWIYAIKQQPWSFTLEWAYSMKIEDFAINNRWSQKCPSC